MTLREEDITIFLIALHRGQNSFVNFTSPNQRFPVGWFGVLPTNHYRTSSSSSFWFPNHCPGRIYPRPWSHKGPS